MNVVPRNYIVKHEPVDWFTVRYGADVDAVEVV